MTTVSRFSRQNDTGLRALNLELVVVLVLEAKALEFLPISDAQRTQVDSYQLLNKDC